jgi:hypothetical protein
MRTLDCQVEAIDLRARLIRDPLLRLRYLRRMTRGGLPVAAVAVRPRRRWRAAAAGAVLRLRYLRRMTRGGLPVAAVAVRPRRRWRAAAAGAVLFLLPAGYHTEANVRRSRPPVLQPEAGSEQPPSVWLVDKAAQFETYSNGLRVETSFAAGNHRRGYVAFPRSGDNTLEPESRAEPAGIVFHSTESQMVAFEPGQTQALQRVGRYLLEYVRDNRCYHFVIDRFGRVYRIVEESDAANHAGWSVWADERWVYVNLNESFLGVAFEAQSRAESGQPAVNSAQLHAARVLIEMLRSKYHIPAANCVTHAQVSINPRNMRVGYHTDWADNFPYRSLGLPDNYERPLAGALVFGFDLDGSLEESGLGRGMLAAQIEMRREAAGRRMTTAAYRAELRSRWRQTISALENRGSIEEKGL